MPEIYGIPVDFEMQNFVNITNKLMLKYSQKVTPSLFQGLYAIRFRNKFGMTD
jgi:hypothetical protein